MVQLVFSKRYSFWSAYISNNDKRLPDIEIKLDSGSPITVISIPSLLQITGESIGSFSAKLKKYLLKCRPAMYGGYGDSDSNGQTLSLQFVPYLLKGIIIEGESIPVFLFWVDISGFSSGHIVNRSTLFGFDYLSLGDKHFDQKDNFYIEFDPYKIDASGVEYAITNYSDEICEIKSELFV